MSIYRISDELVFPEPHEAEPSGLLGVGGDLSPTRLILAYRSGIFPWYSDELPILWFCPDPRAVLLPDHLHIGRTLRKTLRRHPYRLTMDSAFEELIRLAAETPRKGQTGTWITADMIDAYCRLHELGLAHSVECWADGRLAGGLYGVSLGRAFFGESMVSLSPSASTIALACLVAHLRQEGFHFLDCQLPTPHLTRLGAQLWPRSHFLEALRCALREETVEGPWRFAGDPYATCLRSHE